MKRDQALKVLARQKMALRQKGILSIAVFGSTARDEAKPDSDLDILVDFAQPSTFDQYIEAKFYLEELLGCKVDLVTLDGLKPLARVEVEKEAIYVS